MNEQQVADIFSEQIDRLLQGQEIALPANAGELRQLLGLSRQFAQIGFQPGPAAQAAFQAQLAGWFGNGAATILGLPKLLFFVLSAGLLVLATGVGISVTVPLVESFGFGSNQQIAPQQITPTPATDAPDSGHAPAGESSESAPGPANSSQGDSLRTTTNSQGDTITPSNASKEETLPGSPSTGDTLPLPTSTPTPIVTSTPEPTATPVSSNPDNDIGATDDSSLSGAGDSSTTAGAEDSNPPVEGDHDRGHGNDPDGFDEDNPGNSDGIQGNPGNGGDVSDFSRGNEGGGGGQSGGGNSGGNPGRGGGQGGGQGRGRNN